MSGDQRKVHVHVQCSCKIVKQLSMAAAIPPCPATAGLGCLSQLQVCTGGRSSQLFLHHFLGAVHRPASLPRSLDPLIARRGRAKACEERVALHHARPGNFSAEPGLEQLGHPPTTRPGNSAGFIGRLQRQAELCPLACAVRHGVTTMSTILTLVRRSGWCDTAEIASSHCTC